MGLFTKPIPFTGYIKFSRKDLRKLDKGQIDSYGLARLYNCTLSQVTESLYWDMMQTKSVIDKYEDWPTIKCDWEA